MLLDRRRVSREAGATGSNNFASNIPTTVGVIARLTPQIRRVQVSIASSSQWIRQPTGLVCPPDRLARWVTTKLAIWSMTLTVARVLVSTTLRARSHERGAAMANGRNIPITPMDSACDAKLMVRKPGRSTGWMVSYLPSMRLTAQRARRRRSMVIAMDNCWLQPNLRPPLHQLRRLWFLLRIMADQASHLVGPQVGQVNTGSKGRSARMDHIPLRGVQRPRVLSITG